MGSRRSRFAAFFIALALALLSVAGIVTAGTAKAGNVPNPVTGCSEDSFFAGAQTPDPSTPIVTPINTDVTISTIYFDESPINANPGFLPFYTVKDSLGNVVATGSPTQGPPPAGTNLDKFQTLLTATFQIPAKGTYTASIKAWDGDQNKAGGDCGVAMWNVNTPPPATIVLHKTDDHQPANNLPGAVFGLWAGSSVVGNPGQNCTSQADGTCTFSNVDAGTYTIHEVSAPAGYSPDPSTVTVTVAAGDTKDIAQPFVDPRDTGWARIVKVLQDGSGAPVTVADKHVLDGAAFVLYSDKNNNKALDAGETAKLWPDDSKDAACTISGGTGQCDVGPVLPGAYRVHETATPPNMTTGPDVDVTVVKSTSANPVIVNYANIVGSLDINLVKSGPTLAHVGDTFTYTFDATTNGPKLHNIQLAELAPNRCTTAITPATGDTNSNGFLEKGETWHWTCTHTVTAGDPNPLPNTAKVTGTDDFGRLVSATDDHTVIIIHPAIKVEKSGPATAHEGDTVTYSFKVTNTGDAALSDVKVTDDKLGDIGTIALLSAGDSQTLTKDFSVPAGTSVDNTVTACGIDPLSLKVCDDDHHHLVIVHPGITVVKTGPATAHVGDVVTYSFKVTNTGDNALTNVQITDDKLGSIGTIASLAVNESKTLTKDFTVPNVAAVDNTVTACGFDPLSLKVCDDDHHHLVTIHPAIKVEKSGPAEAHEGDTVTYTFKVTNTGDVALTNVTVVDDKLGSVGTISSLDVGASTTLTKDFTIPSPSTSVDNTVTACGTDPLSVKVCDDDHHHLTPKHPAITVVKSGPANATAGQTVTYTFKVTNTGDIDLTNVQVTDDKLGSIGTIASLPIGASTTLTKDFTVPSGLTAVDNTVTACGTDTLSLQVCATDHHHMDVTQVLGENVVRPSAPLAVTGTDLGWRSMIGLLLLLGGVALRVMRRRGRRSEA
jgi:hypothetical protein